MTEKRYELLRRLQRQPAVSIRALARDLGRDFKRVHEDVTALEAIGLIEREGDLLRANYDEIHASIRLDAPAA
jgi:predicted transcriptional regulator